MNENLMQEYLKNAQEEYDPDSQSNKSTKNNSEDEEENDSETTMQPQFNLVEDPIERMKLLRNSITRNYHKYKEIIKPIWINMTPKLRKQMLETFILNYEQGVTTKIAPEVNPIFLANDPENIFKLFENSTLPLEDEAHPWTEINEDMHIIILNGLLKNKPLTQFVTMTDFKTYSINPKAEKKKNSRN